MKKFIRILVFILLFTIIFNFSFYEKSRAEALTIGLGVKALAVILASMGILSTINDSKGGLYGFYEELVEYKDISIKLYTIARDAIINNTKMGLSDLVRDIRSFFENIWAKENLKVESVNPDDDIHKIPSGTYNFSASAGWSLQGAENGTPQTGILWSDGENTLSYRIYATFFKYNDMTVFCQLLMNGTQFFQTGTSVSKFYVTGNNKYSVSASLAFNESSSIFSISYANYDTNKTSSKSVTKAIDKILAITYPPFLDGTIEYDIPKVYDVPRSISFPWTEIQGKSISAHVGKTETELLQDISAEGIQSWVKALEGYNKAELDALAPPWVKWIEQANPTTGVIENVVGDVKGAEVDEGVISDTETKGLLGSILGVLASITDLINDIFSVPDDLSLDFSSLQGLTLADKFPFSLPWDLSRLLNLLVADPVVPRWEFVILNNKLVIDLIKFESLASISRNFLSVIYVASLVLVTRRFIGGA